MRPIWPVKHRQSRCHYWFLNVEQISGKNLSGRCRCVVLRNHYFCGNHSVKSRNYSDLAITCYSGDAVSSALAGYMCSCVLAIGSWVVAVDGRQRSSFTSLGKRRANSPSNCGFIVVYVGTVCSNGCWGLPFRRFSRNLDNHWLRSLMANRLGAVFAHPIAGLKTTIFR